MEKGLMHKLVQEAFPTRNCVMVSEKEAYGVEMTKVAIGGQGFGEKEFMTLFESVQKEGCKVTFSIESNVLVVTIIKETL